MKKLLITVFVIILLNSCSSPIKGEWYAKSKPEAVLIFKENGTVEAKEADRSYTGTYKISEDKKTVKVVFEKEEFEFEIKEESLVDKELIFIKR